MITPYPTEMMMPCDEIALCMTNCLLDVYSNMPSCCKVDDGSVMSVMDDRV